VPAGRESVTEALDRGHDVIVYPGGDLDSLRPWTKRDKVVLAGRKGFVRQAIRSGVPIVPVATTGGADTMPVITDGRRVAKLLRLDKLARSEVFPLAVGFPLGIAPGIIPQIPLPAKIRTEILEPVKVRSTAGLEDDDEYVDEKYREVERALQSGVNRLARKRKFPIFG
jgi:1-acyl-sn-glycerol-3-phosphate acyltransferase